MAAAAEVLPAERELRLAARVQNAPSGGHPDPEDGGVHLQAFLHGSGEWRIHQ